MNKLAIAAGVLVAALFVAASSFFTVQQTQQVLITQFGQPIRVIQTPGLNMKLPFIQNVIVFDRRLLDFEAPGEEVILGDQRRLMLDLLRKAVKYEPDQPDYRVALGNLYADLDMQLNARREYDHALRVKKDHAEAKEAIKRLSNKKP